MSVVRGQVQWPTFLGGLALGLCLAIAPVRQARAEPITITIIALISIGVLFKIGAAIIRSKKSGVDPVLERVQQNRELVLQQREYLAGISDSVFAIGEQLGSIEQRIAKISPMVGEEIRFAFAAKASRQYLGAIETLREDVALKSTTGVEPSVPGAIRLQFVDLYRNELLAEGPLHALPALLVGWQHDMAYRYALGHEEDHVRGMDRLYREYITEIIAALRAGADAWTHRAEQWQEDIGSALARHERNRKRLYPRYGERQRLKDLPKGLCQSATYCRCAGLEDCKASGRSYNVVTKLTGTLKADTLRRLGSRCDVEDASVRVTRVWCKWSKYPGTDEDLGSWLSVAASEGLAERIAAYEAARLMAHTMNGYADAGEFALLDPFDLDYSGHIDNVGEDLWLDRHLSSHERFLQLLGEPRERLIELGVDTVLLHADEYPKAYEIFLLSGHAGGDGELDWQHLISGRPATTHLRDAKSQRICRTGPGRPCLESLLVAPRWWREQGLKAAGWRHSFACEAWRLRSGGHWEPDTRKRYLGRANLWCDDVAGEAVRAKVRAATRRLRDGRTRREDEPLLTLEWR